MIILAVRKLVNTIVTFDYGIDYAGDTAHEPLLIKYLTTSAHASLNESAP